MRRWRAGHARRTPCSSSVYRATARGSRVWVRPPVDHGARRYPVAQVAHGVGAVLVHNRIHLYQRVGEPIAQLQRRLHGPCACAHKAHRERGTLVFMRLHAYRVRKGATAVQRQRAGAHSPTTVHHGGFYCAARKRRQKSDVEKGYDRHVTPPLRHLRHPRRSSRTATRAQTGAGSAPSL